MGAVGRLQGETGSQATATIKLTQRETTREGMISVIWGVTLPCHLLAFVLGNCHGIKQGQVKL